jgi:phospholipase C
VTRFSLKTFRPDTKSMVKTLVLLAASAGAVFAQAQIPEFKHIVIIDQENRTPDNLFQGLCGPTRSLCPRPYNLQNFGIDNKGQTVQLTQVPLGSPFDPNHSHPSFVRMCDLDTTTNRCRMDGLDSRGCSAGTCSFEYVNPSDVAPYLTIAQQYGWANFMFQTNQGSSTPAHQFIFAGTSAPTAEDDREAIFVADTPGGLGCLAPLNAVYPMISPQSEPREFNLINNPLGTVCFSHNTMATLLDKHDPQLSWKYYTPGLGNIWTAPNWIREICQPNSNFTKCTGPEWKNNVDLNPVDVLTDIGACKLRNVIWVIPTGQNSDHPNVRHDTGGPSWVSSIVNKIGESTCTDTVRGKTLTYWQDTAIFITWDDWGGFYDHEPPTFLSLPDQGQGDYQYGFRVPLVVVSAYTPKGYIDDDRHDFGSILRFVEHNFGIVEGALGFADERATTNLANFFNLNRSPRMFKHISAPLGEKFFLNDKRPMEPPDTD